MGILYGNTKGLQPFQHLTSPNPIMTHDRQFYIDRARQQKARALTDAILVQYPGSDVEGLIKRLVRCWKGCNRPGPIFF